MPGDPLDWNKLRAWLAILDEPYYTRYLDEELEGGIVIAGAETDSFRATIHSAPWRGASPEQGKERARQQGDALCNILNMLSDEVDRPHHPR